MTEEGRQLAKKIVLVTGAAKRLGRATALAAARKGADVAITYLKSEREARNLDSLVESLESLERSQPPGPDQVIPLDNRGYNYGEPAFPLADLSRGPQR